MAFKQVDTIIHGTQKFADTFEDILNHQHRTPGKKRSRMHASFQEAACCRLASSLAGREKKPRKRPSCPATIAVLAYLPDKLIAQELVQLDVQRK